MAIRNMLNLDAPIGPCLVRILYGLALLLIALGVVMGVVQGVRAATRIPAMPPLTAQANGPAQMQLPPADQGLREPGMRGRRFADEDGFGPRRFGARRTGPFGLRPARQPALFGAFLIVRTLLSGFIGLLVVRILAEMALSILAMPRRSEL